MPSDIEVVRIPESRVGEKRAELDRGVWRTCRNCGADIPASAPNMAYCDETCKLQSMNQEMGIDYGGDE